MALGPLMWWQSSMARDRQAGNIILSACRTAGKPGRRSGDGLLWCVWRRGDPRQVTAVAGASHHVALGNGAAAPGGGGLLKPCVMTSDHFSRGRVPGWNMGAEVMRPWHT